MSNNLMNDELLLNEAYAKIRIDVDKAREIAKQIRKSVLDFKNGNMSKYIFSEKIKKYIFDLIHYKTDVVIIDESYPQIFMNLNFRFRTRSNKVIGDYIEDEGLYISESIFRQFSVDEVTAAILHEIGHYSQNISFSKVFLFLYSERIANYMFLSQMIVAYQFYKHAKHKLIESEYYKKHGDKSNSYRSSLNAYLNIAVLIFIMVLLLFFLFSKVMTGIFEKDADRFVVQLGFGKPLVSFIRKYRDIQDMYGKTKLAELIKMFNESINKFLNIIKLYPDDKDRICSAAREFVKFYYANKSMLGDSKELEWAIQQQIQYCKDGKIDNSNVEKISKMADNGARVIGSMLVKNKQLILKTRNKWR